MRAVSSTSTPSRWCWVTAVVAVLLLVLGTPVSAATEDPAPVERWAGGGDCPAVVQADASAVTVAVACGRDVEVLDERTEWSTLHAQPDGYMRLDVSVVALRSQVNGRWEPIDTTLVVTDDGVEVAAPVAEMRFSDGGDGQPLVRMVHDGHELSFDVPFDLPEPLVYGSALEYADVLPGVDLIVVVNQDGTGFSEVLRVKTPEAAADPRLAELAFPLEVSDGLDLAEVEGGFAATDGDGEAVFAAPAPMMWDSGADTAVRPTTPALRPGSLVFDERALSAGAAANAAARLERPVGGDQVAVVPLDLVEDAVQITPVAEMVDDPATVWPVYIDPPLGVGEVDWTTISSAGWKHYRFAGDDGLGYCNSTASGCSTPLFRARMMWEFGDLGQIGAMEPGDVISATFTAYGTHSYSCSAYPVSAWRVGGFTANTGWPGVWYAASSSDPYYGGVLDTRTVAHRAQCSAASQKPRNIEWNITRAIQWVAKANANAVAIGLRDPNETTMDGWKRYGKDTTISIVYDRAPTAVTNVGTTNPSSTCGTSTVLNSTTPTLRATLFDPDYAVGDTVFARFTLQKAGGNVVTLATTPQAAKADGVPASKTVPAGTLQSGHTYTVTARAVDLAGREGPVTTCTITIDTEAPAAPSVTPVATGYPAAYTTDGPTGGVDVEGAFTFASVSSDVTEYRYTINTQPGVLRPDYRTGQWGVVRFTPDSVGPQRIEVEAVDSAGNVSATSTYRFYVAFPGVLGQWFLDEGGATLTAPDSVTPGHPLTIHPGADWVPGLLTDFGFGGGDRGLLIGPDQAAKTLKDPVVATNESFTVMAFVRLDDTSADATAVSQDGELASGFELGYRTQGCPNHAPGCWAFSMNATDDLGTPAATVATSNVPVVAGEWVQLTGVHNANDGEISMYVCALGTPADPVVNPFPVRSAPVAHTVTWNQIGPFVLGRGWVSGAAAHRWVGAISAVTAYDAALDPPAGESDNTEVLTACQAGAPAPLDEE